MMSTSSTPAVLVISSAWNSLFPSAWYFGVQPRATWLIFSEYCTSLHFVNCPFCVLKITQPWLYEWDTNKMALTESRNIIQASQQQEAFMLIHRTGERWSRRGEMVGKGAVGARDSKSGVCKWILPLQGLKREGEGAVYPSVTTRLNGVLNGINWDSRCETGGR